jgi:ectoine hydroxylase-related dioxygenase (phytanoyl-CoA dioxygenase family)
MALQDVDLNMGPTVYMPRTNTEKIHETFKDEVVADGKLESPKDELLRTTKTVLGTLHKGDCAIYDSRLLHCGSANRGKAEMTRQRTLFSKQVKSKLTHQTSPFF